MEFEYRYLGSSAIESSARNTDVSFAPDTLRDPTFFSGTLNQHVPFREGMSALHDVVVQDLNWKPKDKTAYKEWAAQREEVDWQAVAAQRADVKGKLETLQGELDALRKNRQQRWSAFWGARQKYFDYLYTRDKDAWFVLDPVITVHPDEVFFECFSVDESSYGRLGASHDVFLDAGEMSFGTTNVDYSDALYSEMQKIRSYKETRFEIDPSGFEVETQGEDAYTEVKIDLPDSWVRGFLQVGSAMSMDAVSCELHPMDVHNLCFVLRRHRELKGPRGMRWHLEPDKPVRVVFEPWELEVECPRSVYAGTEAHEIRTWGRRRLHVLERLIPVARKFTVHLVGTGMPYFFVADLGDLSFTLGLSGWTANDWSRAGNFDLLAPRATADDVTRRRVFEALRKTHAATGDELSRELSLDRREVLGALSAYAQAGRAMFDLNKNVWRARELSREPLPMAKLRFANEREEKAGDLVTQGAVSIQDTRHDDAGNVHVKALVKQGDKRFEPELTIDRDDRLFRATCTCNFFQQNKLFKGPCEHVLAARGQRASNDRATDFIRSRS